MVRWYLCKVRIACLATLVSISALGQNHSQFPWWNSPIAEDLNLSQGQKQKIHQIVRSYRDRLLDARNAHEKAVLSLEDALNEPEVTLQTAKPIIDRVTGTQADASRIFLEMSTQIRGVLTLEQWRQLVKRWDEVQKKRPSDTQVPPE